MPTVLVTGANRGIGLEFARQFAGAGWRVHATARDLGAARELREVRGDIHLHELDVTDDQAVAALARELSGEALDLLLNNAGVGDGKGSLEAFESERWMRVLRVNAVAPMVMARAFLPSLERGGRKLIVSITSRMGSIADNNSGGYYPYRSSKAALNMANRSLAADLAPRGITAVVCHPGWVQTDMGGPGAPLSVEESVSNLRRLIDRLKPADSGKFFNHDGSPLPW